MGFRINTNVAALNAKANSDLNAKSLDSSLARLSSGLRINSQQMMLQGWHSRFFAFSSNLGQA